MTTIVDLPFTYGKPSNTLPSEYYRLDPNIYKHSRHFQSPPRRKKTPKADKVAVRVVRDVKKLPKHLIGRVHTADTSNKAKKVMKNAAPGAQFAQI